MFNDGPVGHVGSRSRSRYIPITTLDHPHWHCHRYPPQAAFHDIVGDDPHEGDRDALIETACNHRACYRLVSVRLPVLDLLEVGEGALAGGPTKIEGGCAKLARIEVEARRRVLLHLIGERLLSCLARFIRSVGCGCRSESGVDDRGVNNVAESAWWAYT